MDTSDIGPEDVAAAAKRSWRRHSVEFKSRVIELARQPGTSVAAVALANGLNANMLRRWVYEVAAGNSTSKTTASSVAPALASFVQLPMREPATHPVPDARPVQPAIPAAVSQQRADIAVEIHRNGATVHAKLPMDDRSAAWLREVLG
jgi:transposase-like protein